MTRLIAGLLLGLFAAARPPHVARPAPQLVVLIAIDQMRADYFDRFASQLSGGLGRIRKRSAFFRHGLQDHAVTETAPGHSTMLSGRDPAHTGIISNSRGVQDPLAPILGVTGGTPGASPRRFVGTTLYDWMLATDSTARVLSVSRKDRGAIFPVGRARGSVFWYTDGKFTTSSYYADTLPGWVTEYNARRGPMRLAGAVWQLLLPDSAYAERDSMWFENGGSDIAFPHRLADDSAGVLQSLASYPWMDSLTLDFALTGPRELGLGRHERPDLLAVSLSTTDAIGHAFGPDSRELHDQILRLDRWLGGFLDSLQALVPGDRIVLALTSDHGVTSYPEYAVAVQHRKGGRVWLGDVVRGPAAALAKRYRTDFEFDFDTGLLTADVAALRSRGVSVDSLAESLAREARHHVGIAKVYTPASLRRARRGDVDAGRWRRLLPVGLGWLFCAVPKPGYVWSSGKQVAEHGTAGPDDVEVPIAFMGPGIRAVTVTRPVRTVDIGPTLAAYLGIRPTEAVDGRALAEVVSGAVANAGGGDPDDRRGRTRK